MNTDFSDWYDISDPATIDAMPTLDISKADYLRDRREMKRVFHAFGLVTNNADGRTATFPAASVGKMLYMSGIDIHGIAAAFADLYRYNGNNSFSSRTRLAERDCSLTTESVR